ncbi:MAG: hypothetical protein J7K72_03205 [Candidatus Aenigmarchaeota archaeon]|nr:hypothetical protein [Candidatus Aenigmarchaeota archaeon]
MVIYNERGVIGTLEKIKESMGCIPDEVTIKITKKETDQDQIYKEGIKIDNTTYAEKNLCVLPKSIESPEIKNKIEKQLLENVLELRDKILSNRLSRRVVIKVPDTPKITSYTQFY